MTSGPGATNTVTGLLDALMDSVPVVCLTGQVPTHMIGNDAFQEADTTGITRPVTKHNYLVKRAGDLARTLHEAFYVARSGRPGPVVVDLPKDIVVGPASYAPASEAPHRSYRPVREPARDAVAAAVAAMRRARRPLFYTGGGVINSGPAASEALGRLVRLTGFPCTSTLMGLGAYPTTGPAVPRHARHARHLRGQSRHPWLRRADQPRRPLRRSRHRPAGRVLAALDQDPRRHRRLVDQQDRAGRHPVLGDAGRAILMMIEAWERSDAPVDREALAAWWRQIDGWRAIDSLAYRQDPSPSAVIKPQHAIRRLHALSSETGRDTFVTTEVGQHQMWAATHFQYERPNRWMTSGGLGTMGYGLPAAIGVQVAHPDALVIDIAGEASTLMNIQELGTIAQYRLPVKLFILNNRYMGMVRQWQELLHGSRYSESYSDALPDFVKLADAFQATGMRAANVGELDDVIRRMLAHDGPVVADICVDETENCYPMIPSGAPHNEMILGPEQSGRATQITNEGLMLV